MERQAENEEKNKWKGGEKRRERWWEWGRGRRLDGHSAQWGKLCQVMDAVSVASCQSPSWTMLNAAGGHNSYKNHWQTPALWSSHKVCTDSEHYFPNPAWHFQAAMLNLNYMQSTYIWAAVGFKYLQICWHMWQEAPNELFNLVLVCEGKDSLEFGGWRCPHVLHSSQQTLTSGCQSWWSCQPPGGPGERSECVMHDLE